MGSALNPHRGYPNTMTAPDAMKKMMRAAPPNFAFDVKSSRKPAKPRTFHGYVNGKRAARVNEHKTIRFDGSKDELNFGPCNIEGLTHWFRVHRNVDGRAQWVDMRGSGKRPRKRKRCSKA